MNKGRRRLGWVFASTLVWAGVSGLHCAATPPLTAEIAATEVVAPTEGAKPIPEKAPLTAAFEAATTAAQMAQSATTVTDWSRVAMAWSEAIAALQAVPTDSPEWLFAQRKAREYLVNQEIALQRVEEAGILPVFPTLGNEVLDEQVAVYLSYVATFGTPDIMVIGSSRALQGLNPQVLQRQLAEQGLESLKVYTFAVNGATAQVMSFILRQLLTPEQMPRMIVWAGGSRSFNSGRVDRTFAKILESPGYAAVQAGERPTIGWVDGERAMTSGDKARTLSVTDINGYGFLEVREVFDPNVYYRSFPRVAGLYDEFYQRFDLNGVQTVSFRAIAAFTRTHDIPLVFVNLPLSADYLDETRMLYEQQFQQFLLSESNLGGFTVVDLLQAWPDHNNIFADPSHLNRFGAAQVATRLAADPTVPWSLLNPETEAIAEEPSEDAAEATDPENADANQLTDPESQGNNAADTLTEDTFEAPTLETDETGLDESMNDEMESVDQEATQ